MWCIIDRNLALMNGNTKIMANNYFMNVSNRISVSANICNQATKCSSTTTVVLSIQQEEFVQYATCS